MSTTTTTTNPALSHDSSNISSKSSSMTSNSSRNNNTFRNSSSSSKSLNHHVSISTDSISISESLLSEISLSPISIESQHEREKSLPLLSNMNYNLKSLPLLSNINQNTKSQMSSQMSSQPSLSNINQTSKSQPSLSKSQPSVSNNSKSLPSLTSPKSILKQHHSLSPTSSSNMTCSSPPTSLPLPLPLPLPQIKTSISHPINISWIIPPEFLSPLTTHNLPSSTDLYSAFISPNIPNYLLGHKPNLLNQNIMGNIALSSCPGKKVRLDAPVKGRASVKRDLEQDLQRIKNHGIHCIVCCLKDEELNLLGAPWLQYREIALKFNLEIIRIPMIEGSTPDSLHQIDWVLKRIDIWIDTGKSVLIHCRGGVGRAGLVACCWLLHRRYILDAERSILFVRLRRSHKAIETPQQAQFIVAFDAFKKSLRNLKRIPILDPFANLPDLMMYAPKEIQDFSLTIPMSIRQMSNLNSLMNRWFQPGNNDFQPTVVVVSSKNSKNSNSFKSNSNTKSNTKLQD